MGLAYLRALRANCSIAWARPSCSVANRAHSLWMTAGLSIDLHQQRCSAHARCAARVRPDGRAPASWCPWQKVLFAANSSLRTIQRWQDGTRSAILSEPIGKHVALAYNSAGAQDALPLDAAGCCRWPSGWHLARAQHPPVQLRALAEGRRSAAPMPALLAGCFGCGARQRACVEPLDHGPATPPACSTQEKGGHKATPSGRQRNGHAVRAWGSRAGCMQHAAGADSSRGGIARISAAGREQLHCIAERSYLFRWACSHVLLARTRASRGHRLHGCKTHMHGHGTLPPGFLSNLFTTFYNVKLNGMALQCSGRGRPLRQLHMHPVRSVAHSYEPQSSPPSPSSPLPTMLTC